MKSFNKDFTIDNKIDTLIITVKLDSLEALNLTSALLLRDLILHDTYPYIIHYKYIVFIGTDKNNIGYGGFSNCYPIEKIQQEYSHYNTCPNLYIAKKYIHDSCGYAWVMNGNTALRILKNNFSDFDSLTKDIFLFGDNPDITSLLIEFTNDCCTMNNGARFEALTKVDNAFTKNELKQFWPEYGSHVKHIMNLCFTK